MAGFSLYVRKRKKGKPIYYAQFRTTTGSWSTAKSTGCTTRRAAEQFCEAYLRKKAYFLPGTTVTFLEFSKNFFSWEGDWATDKRMNGKRISRRHCIERNEILRNHVLLVFGPYNLTDIDRAQIKRFKLELYRNSYSGSLINKCLYILRAILTAAEERELIKAVPTIERAAENPRPKGILSIDEVNRLFSAPWGDFRGYVGNLLAASTGLRIGELQGLVIEDLHLDDGYIIVRRSWDRCTGMLNETTKTGRSRTILIPERVRQEIQRLISIHPNPEPGSFLFFGEKKPEEKPAEQEYFTRTLYRALATISIDEARRKERNITFHSWRHWLNSLLINAKIPLQKIQSITGHRTDRMSEHYYHLDDMADIRQIQERLFPLPATSEEQERQGGIH